VRTHRSSSSELIFANLNAAQNPDSSRPIKPDSFRLHDSSSSLNPANVYSHVLDAICSCTAMFATAPIEPAPPETNDLPAILLEAADVSGQPIVAEVAFELSTQLFHLPAQRLVTKPPTPLVHRFERPTLSLAGSLSLHYPTTLLASAPVMGEAQKVEGLRWCSASDGMTLLPVVAKLLFPTWKRA
jgi:hypothetical protein